MLRIGCAAAISTKINPALTLQAANNGVSGFLHPGDQRSILQQFFFNRNRAGNNILNEIHIREICFACKSS